MKDGFPSVLSLLRREKGVNQRAAASKLQISQALLSHYENGLREPGLDFLIRACDYYGVSADYLLGRTDGKTAGFPGGEDSLSAACCRGVVELFTSLEKQGDEALTNEAAEAVAVTLYKLARLLGDGEGCVLEKDEALPLCAAAVSMDEAGIAARVKKSGAVDIDPSAFADAAEPGLLRIKEAAGV